MSIYGNALASRFPARRQSLANLLFDTRFTGMAVDAGHYEATQRDWHQDFTDSVDSITGADIVNDLKALWGSNTNIDILSIPQDNVPDSTTFATYFSSNFASNQLSLEINSAFGLYPTYTIVPQTMLNIVRTPAQATGNDMDELCVSTRFKLPAGLDLTGNPAAGKYLTLFEWKEGGYNGLSGVGEQRIEVMVNRALSGDAYNQWYVKVDNNANGAGNIPGFVSKDYYTKRSGLTAQLDVWTRLWVYWNRPAGRLVVIIQVDGQARQLLVDMYPEDLNILAPELGGQLYGLHKYPICRLEACMMYQTAYYPSTVKFSDMQIWDKLPIPIP